MEDNTVINPNTQMYNNTNIQMNNNDTNKKDAHHRKLIKIISITAIILLVVLVVLYFLNKKIVNNPVEIVPPVQDRIQNMQDTVNATKEQGRPAVKTQLDIMKLNSGQ